MAQQLGKGNLRRTAKSPPTPKNLPGMTTDMQGGMSMPLAPSPTDIGGGMGGGSLGPTDMGPPGPGMPMGAPQFSPGSLAKPTSKARPSPKAKKGGK
jgi:hypothetical protein